MRSSIATVGFLLAACPSSEPARTHDNPEILWLALDGNETQVRLVPVQPIPF